MHVTNATKTVYAVLEVVRRPKVRGGYVPIIPEVPVYKHNS